MRFSLPTVHLIVRFGRNEKGILHEDNLVNSIKRVVDLGLQNIELCLDHANIRSEQCRERAIDTIVALKERHKLSFTAHLPYRYTDISALDEGIRKVSVDNVVSAIKMVDRLDVEAFVIHVLGLCAEKHMSHNSPSSREVMLLILKDMFDQADKSLHYICNAVEPRKIAIENLPFAPVYRFIELMERHGCSFCLDVGKAIIIGDDPISLLKEQLNHISDIHIHDTVKKRNGLIADHQVIGRGFAPIKEFLKLCEEVHYQGPVVLELLNERDAVESLKYLKLGKFSAAGLTLPVASS